MKINYYFLLIGLLSLYGLHVKAQGLETFESVGENATTFTNNGYTFSVSPLFDSQKLNKAGAGDSHYFLDNKDDTGVNKTYAISITGGATYFTMKSVEVYVSSNATGNQPTNDGAVTFRGKKNGVTVFTYTKNSGFPTTLADPANGYSKINFLSLPGVGDVSSININKLEISHSGAFQYISIDNFKFGAEVLETDPPVVNSITLNGNPPTTANSIAYTVIFSEDAVNVSTDDFVLDATGTSGTIASVSGSGTTYTVTVNNISGEGTISIDLKANTNIADNLGNSPPAPFTNGTVHTVSRCYKETFESVNPGSSSFSSNAVNFTTSPTHFKVEHAFQSGASGSHRLLSNLNDQGIGKKYSIKTSGGNLFTMDDIEVYLSSQNNGAQPTNDGSLIVRGKQAGNTLFSITKNTGFPTTRSGANKGFFVLDFATSGASNHSLTNIDELEVEIGGAFKYIALDNFGHCEKSTTADPPIVQSIKLVGNPLGNTTLLKYEVIFNENALNVSTDDFILTSTGTASGTITSVTGSGNAYTVNVAGITGEGSLRLDLRQSTNIKDTDGNTPPDPFTAGEVHIVTNCQVETFEALNTGIFSWIRDGVPFTTGSANLSTALFANAGAGRSDKFLDNKNNQGTAKTYTISITNADKITMQSMEVYLSSIANGGNNPTNNGTLTIKGKLDGVQQYAVTKTTGFLNAMGTTQGFFTWNFASEGGANNSGTDIDELEITLDGAFQYIAIDNFKYCKKEYDCNSSSILYVNTNASGTATGTDWANAYVKLEDALIHAKSCSNITQIWVASGTYKPTSGNDQTASFAIPAGVKLYGGFAGTETALDARDWAANPTILSGDLNKNNKADAGDSHTIVTILTDNVVVDGFQIEYSYADDDTDNSQVAIGRTGGGIYIRNAGKATINNCIFRKHNAHGNGTNNGIGGAIINFQKSTTITNCLFYNNKASASGGAISGESGTVTVINCTIANNNASEGGGVHFFAANVSMMNSIFTNNSGTNGNINKATTGTGIGTANHCMFYNSTASNNGNVPPNITGANNITNTDPIYISTSNYALAYGSPATNKGNNSYVPTGMLTDLAGKPRIANTTIDIGAYENHKPNPTNNILYVSKGGAGAKDGSSWANALDELARALNWASQQPATATENLKIYVAKGTYKPLYKAGNGTTDRDKAFVLVNKVKVYGGFAGTETSPAQRNLSITTNKTTLSGDIGTAGDNTDNAYHVVISVSDTKATVLDGFTITGGNANGDVYNSITLESKSIKRNHGGGMYNESSSLSITNTTFSGNTASGYSHGGGMYNNHGSPTITNTIFSGNKADKGGGMFNESSSPSITNTTFSGNTTKDKGGGMYNSYSSPTITNSTFIKNETDNDGGGMFNSNSSLTITNSTFRDNLVVRNGGGMYNEGRTSPSITNCTFIWNIAIRKGGGMYNHGASPSITNSTFRRNKGADGGGMCNYDYSNPTITNTTFFENFAIGDGGGIYNNLSNPSRNITNCTFIGNIANRNGGGMFNDEHSYPSIIHSTFIGNTAGTYGGGMYSSGGYSPSIIYNSIFWDNKQGGSATVAGADIKNISSVLTVEHTLLQVEKTTANYPITGKARFIFASTDKNIYKQDPLFVDAANGDLRLQCASPAINAGNNAPKGVTMPTTDMAGAARKQDGTVDMGAYESTPIIPATSLSGTSLALAEGLHKSSNTITDGNMKHYCTCDNKLLLSLGSNSNVPDNGVSLKIGATKVSHYAKGTGFVNNPDGAVLMNRTWNAVPTTQPSGEVDVRYYFTQEEYAAINASITSKGGTALTSVEQMQFYKSKKAGAHLAVANIPIGKVIRLDHGTTPSTKVWTLGTFNTNDHYAEFKVANFSGGGGGGASGGQSILPVEYLSFTAEQGDDAVVLDWVTASELNNSHFEVEHSTNGIVWHKIGEVDGNGTTTDRQSYQYTHTNPAHGINYYRLKQVDFDGKSEYSKVVMAKFGKVSTYSIYPNPVHSLLRIEKSASYKIYNILGAEVMSGTGDSIDVESLDSGTYTIHIEGTVQKFVKM